MRSRWPYGVAVAAALAVAAIYLASVLRQGPALGFPLDDAYIYMTYAKQIARLHPFTYFDGGGYSAGATSMLWPVLLAPFWALGLRGPLFSWGVFAVCTGLLALTACLLVDIARRLFGPVRGTAAAFLALGLVLSSGTVTWTFLSGMEVPLAATLLLACADRLLVEGEAPPSRTLLLLLAGAALARPEPGLLVAAFVVVRAGLAPRQAVRWLAPLAPLVVVALANKLLAGHTAPNTAVVKSQIFLPGFSWSDWPATTFHEMGAFFDGVFWSGLGGNEPIFLPKLSLLAYLAGGVRLVLLGRKTGRLSGALFLALIPVVTFAVVLAISGMWRFQAYRYIAAALPAFLLVAALALAPPERVSRWPIVIVYALAGAALAFFGRALFERDVRMFTQGARDNNGQVVRIGQWIDANLPPDAYVAIHDVGAIGYYSHRRLLDVIGLITNGQAEVCNQGPGARFEAFERMEPAQRPTHFAYYGGWLLTGSRDLFGKKLFSAAVPPALGGPRLVGAEVMDVYEARWDVLGSGARPFDDGGWKVADEVDVADLVSERDHAWRGDLGARRLDTPTANWTQYLSATVSGRTVGEGGRAIRAGGERFVLSVDPSKPVRLVVRTGGPTSMPTVSVPAGPKTLVVSYEKELGRLELPAPSPEFAEVAIDLPPGKSRLELTVREAGGRPYRVYHWFALQP